MLFNSQYCLTSLVLWIEQLSKSMFSVVVNVIWRSYLMKFRKSADVADRWPAVCKINPLLADTAPITAKQGYITKCYYCVMLSLGHAHASF